MRARARIVVSAALLGCAVLFGTPGQTAAAPSAGAPSSGQTTVASSPTVVVHPAFFEEQSESFLSSDASTGFTDPASDANTDTHHADPMAQSPAIGLPPAVASGLGLLCTLAACMGLRRFAYRSTHVSRRH